MISTPRKVRFRATNPPKNMSKNYLMSCGLVFIQTGDWALPCSVTKGICKFCILYRLIPKCRPQHSWESPQLATTGAGSKVKESSQKGMYMSCRLRSGGSSMVDWYAFTQSPGNKITQAKREKAVYYSSITEEYDFMGKIHSLFRGMRSLI